MGKTYVGNSNDVARETKKIYVGVSGTAKKVINAYVGVNGVARLIYAYTRPVPAEYQQVEYLENTNAQWIRTDILAAKPLSFRLVFTITSTSGDGTLVGARQTASFMPIHNKGGSWQNIYNVGSGTKWRQAANSYNAVAGVKYTIESVIAEDLQMMSRDGVTMFSYTDTNITSLASNTIGIFNCNGASYPKKGKLYSLKIYDDSTFTHKIADYYPCVRKSDSVPGLYDIVGKNFFTNVGSGTFSYGDPCDDDL